MLTPCPDEAVGPPSAGTMPLGKFTGRLLVVLVIAALAGALWQLADILVLLFGAVTLAIGLFAASTAEFGGALRCRGFSPWTLHAWLFVGAILRLPPLGRTTCDIVK